MAEQYKHLIQALGKTATENVLLANYNNITIIKDIVVCNQDTETRLYNIAIVKDSEIIGPKSYVFYNTKIDPKETMSITVMWTLDEGSNINFWADKDDVVSLNVFGIIVD